MKVIDFRTMYGANVYHSRPVLVTTVELEEKTDVGSHEIPDFTERLINSLPGLWEHRCSPGYPGGFIERLKKGTYFAHIVEHVALELSSLAGIEVNFGKSVYGGSPGRYLIITRFRNEEGMKNLIRGAVDLVNKLYLKEDFDIEGLIKQTQTIIEDSELGPSARAIVEAAQKRRIPWRRIGKGSLLQLGYGSKRRRIQTAVTDRTSLIATDLVQDKALTKTVLKEAFVPVPEGDAAHTIEEGLEIFRSLQPPVAVKPLKGHHGDGVSLNINDETSFRVAFDLALKQDASVVVERMCAGKDFRVLVLNGKVIAAAERVPAHIIGNGKTSVRALIDELNRDPLRGFGHSRTLTRVEIDPFLEITLQRQGVNLETVPESGQRIFLKETANISTGGTARDVTDIIHPEIRGLCERAARAVDLDICGIDLIQSDITQPIDSETAILEINAGPGLRMHVQPSEGKSRDVGGAIIEALYPQAHQSRIPIVAITGTNGKTTVARMVAHILSGSGFGTIGLTTSDGIYVGDKKVTSGDMTGPLSTRAVLSDPRVDTAVLEIARGGLVRSGLAYDWSDVGILTNVRPDHFGQDGIESIEDLVRVKSIVIERVREGGVIVLNADDHEASHLMDMPSMQECRREVIYYSLNSQNPKIARHLEEGGRAVFVANGMITEASRKESYRYGDVRQLPFTMSGAAWFQVSNALAAIGGCLGLGASRQSIMAALQTFDNDRFNLGRLNVYRVRDGFVILDYGHNPDAIEAMADFVRVSQKKSTAILGLPGDRSDDLLRQSGISAARGFDRIILRDDIDRRGRAPGEVPRLVCDAVFSADPKKNCETVLNEIEAIHHAIDTMEPDEVVVLFYDKYELAMEGLRAYDPIPVTSPQAFFNASEEAHVFFEPQHERENVNDHPV